MVPLPGPRAYSYVRFSTPEQLKGDSLRRQIELSVAYAREHGLQLDEDLTFRDLGVSAFNKSNLGPDGQLRAFLDAIDRGIVASGSYLLVESLDRLSRAAILDAMEVFTGILNRGITVVTLGDGMVYSKEKANRQFTDLIISITIMSRAHEESVTKSNRLTAAWAAKRRAIDQKKLTGQCPAWLRLNAERDRFEEIPEKVALVMQIIRLVRSGLGKGSITKQFNEKGIPTIAPERRVRGVGTEVAAKARDRSWYESYIAKILKSRALIGEFQPHKMAGGKRVPDGGPVRDYFPRLLPDEEFALLQNLISERGHRAGGNRGRAFSNLFTGLAKCGYCGSSMVYVNKGEDKRGDRDNRKNKFLVCGKAKRGAGCYHVPWTYADFEEAFFRYARHAEFEAFVRMSNDAGAQVRTLRDEFIAGQARRSDLILKRDRLVEALAGGDGKPRAVLDKITELEVAVETSEKRLKQLEDEIRSIGARQRVSDEAIEALKTVADALQTSSGDDRFLYRAQLNEHLRRVIERLALFPGGMIHSPEEVAAIKAEILASQRYAPEDVDAYAAAMLNVAPQRHDRFFVIRNRSEVFQILRPDSPVPQIIEVMARHPELYVESMRLQRERAAIAVENSSSR